MKVTSWFVDSAAQGSRLSSLPCSACWPRTSNDPKVAATALCSLVLLWDQSSFSRKSTDFCSWLICQNCKEKGNTMICLAHSGLWEPGIRSAFSESLEKDWTPKQSQRSASKGKKPDTGCWIGTQQYLLPFLSNLSWCHFFRTYVESS